MKKLKVFWTIALLVLGISVSSLVLSACSGTEPFVGGFISGVGAMKVMADQTQQEFNQAVELLQHEKAEIDQLIDQLPDDPAKAALKAWVDDQTLEHIEELRETDWKDPKVLSGYGLALISLLTAGYQKYQRTQESGLDIPRARS